MNDSFSVMTGFPAKIFQDVLSFGPGEFNFGLFAGYLNYPPGKPVPPGIRALLEERLLPVIGRIPLHYQYRILPIAGRDARLHDIVIGDSRHLSGNLVYRLLRGSSHVIAHLISTPGRAADDPVDAYVYYAFYNTLLQMGAEHLRSLLIRQLNIPEIRLTRRYAPGYCGWPVRDQRVLLNLLEPAAIGVHFTDALMLEPAHSISGIFGLRSQERTGGDMPCYHCTSLTCRVHDDFNKELLLIEGGPKP